MSGSRRIAALGAGEIWSLTRDEDVFEFFPSFRRDGR
jgi:hypothetical protein